MFLYNAQYPHITNLLSAVNSFSESLSSKLYGVIYRQNIFGFLTRRFMSSSKAAFEKTMPLRSTVP